MRIPLLYSGILFLIILAAFSSGVARQLSEGSQSNYKTDPFSNLSPPKLEIASDTVAIAEIKNQKPGPQPSQQVSVKNKKKEALPDTLTIGKGKRGRLTQYKDSTGLASTSSRFGIGETVIKEKELRAVIDSYIGYPYKYGGTTTNGFDCSGFVRSVMARLGFYNLPRTSSNLFQIAQTVPRGDLQPGDLLFFREHGRGIDHVGIFVGDNIFAHASARNGIAYSVLDDQYFKPRLVGIRRMNQ